MASAAVDAAGTPPYTVEFFVDDVSAGTATTTDPYTLDLGVLADGPHEVYATVTDSTDPTPETATSATHSFTVAPATGTTTTLASSANPSTYGNATVTATVAAADMSTLSGGAVQFYDGGAPLGTPVTIDTGTGEASYDISTLGVATHSITADYSGDGIYSASSASALSQVINQAVLTVTANGVFRPTDIENLDPLPYKITGYQNGGNMMDAHVNSTLDPGDGSNLFDMEVTNVPFAVYDVIFYIGASRDQFGDGKGVIVFNGGPERAFTLKPGAFDGTFTEMVDATTPGIETVLVTLSPGLFGGPKLFVRIVQDDGEILSENFEAGDGGFETDPLAGSDWEHGTPDSNSPVGPVTEGNGGSMNCWGTKLGAYGDGSGDPGYYSDAAATTSLRSPVVDLTGVAAAELSFAEALDLQGSPLDAAVVNIIDDTTDTVISAAIYAADDSATTTDVNWNPVGPIAIPAGALGQKVRFEWEFTGEAGATNQYIGWYIDDVNVNLAMP